MHQALIIRGRFAGQVFLPEEPLPAVEGAAELIIFPSAQQAGAAHSIFDLFGKAANLRSAGDIATQLQQERSSWGEP
jgi:hypothetical protein